MWYLIPDGFYCRMVLFPDGTPGWYSRMVCFFFKRRVLYLFSKDIFITCKLVCKATCLKIAVYTHALGVDTLF